MTENGTKFWYVFKLHGSDLHTKTSHHIHYILFYRALQKFEYNNIYCSFLMTPIGTKFWYVFKLHRSDLHTKISHRIQHIFLMRVVNLSVCLFNIHFGYNFRKNSTMAKKFRFVFELYRFSLHMKNCVVPYIDLFIVHFKNFNTLIFFVNF